MSPSWFNFSLQHGVRVQRSSQLASSAFRPGPLSRLESFPAAHLHLLRRRVLRQAVEPGLPRQPHLSPASRTGNSIFRDISNFDRIGIGIEVSTQSTQS